MNSFVMSSTLAILAGFIVMSYRQYAERYGWAIGGIYYTKESWLGFFVWACVIPATIQLIFELSFLKGIGITIGLFFIAPVVIYIFKTWVQYLWIVLIILSIIIWMVGGIEVINVNH